MKLVLHAFAAILLTGVASGEDGESPPGVNSLVEQASAAMEACKSISMTVKARLEHREGALRDSRLGKDKPLLTGEATVVMAKGERIRVEMREGDDHLATVVIDGETVFEWDVKENRWTKYPVLWRQQDSFPPQLLVRTPLWLYYLVSWVDDDGLYRKWVAETHSKGGFKSQAVETIEGQSCRVLRIERKQEIGNSLFTETGFFAFDATTLLPARIEVTTTLHDIDNKSTTLLSKDMQRFTFHQVTRDVEVSDETFAFHAPPESQFVDPDGLRPEDPLVGKPVPAPAEIHTLDGKTLSLAKLNDKKPVLLMFWATWCTPCKIELPQLQQLRKEYGEDRLSIIAVSIDPSLAPVRSYLDKHDFSYTLAHDADGRLAKTFGLVGPPMTVLVDQKGTVTKVWRGWGEGHFEPLRKRIKRMLSQEKP